MKTMTKKYFLKLAMTLVVAFIFKGVMGQDPTLGTEIPGHGEYISSEADGAGTVYMIEGATIPLYVLPDALYHPNYVLGTNWTLTDDFTWVWSHNGVDGAELSFGINNANDNYTTVTASADSEGIYVVTAIERAPVAWGGCDDGGTTVTIEVVPQPSVGFGGNQEWEGCVGGTGIPSVINASIAGGWQNYHLAWTLEIRTEDINGAIDFYYDDEDGAFPTAGQKFAENYTTADPQSFETAVDHDIMTVDSFEVIDDKPTVYTYTLTSINDQASRFGNFIGLDGVDTNISAFEYYLSGETYTVTVYPTPETGPIYHIPSTWAN